MEKDHDKPIVNTYRPKPPGAGRDRRRAIISIVVVAGMAALVWILLGSNKEFTLLDYTQATVEAQTLNEVLQVSGSIETPLRRSVLAPEEGTLAQKLAATGDWIGAEAGLAVLEAPGLDDSLTALTKNLADAERNLSKMEAERKFSAERTAIELAKKERALADAVAALERAEQLEASGAGTAKETTDKRSALQEAEESLQLARISAEESLFNYEFSHESTLDSISELIADIAELEERIAGLTVSSPIAGRVLSWQAEEGDRISRYSALAIVADTTRPQAVFQVPESSADRLSTGMAVAITVNGSVWPGTIVNIGREATASDTYGTTVDITVDFSGDHPEFTAGVSASGEILLGTKTEALVLPRGPYLSSGGNRYVYVLRDGFAEKTMVSFGISYGSTIEILAGLNSGDQIITSDYTAFIQEERIKLGGKQ